MMAPSNELHIKNMVCERCKMAVRRVLEESGVDTEEVSLGLVRTREVLDDQKLAGIAKNLQALGFDLLERGKSRLISRIKTLIIENIHGQQGAPKMNFSTYLSENLHYEYSYLSRLFSSVEGITIEKYITQQRIEKVKELLFYDELSLSEISYQLEYSSVAHLSAQFKKETGMTPTQFKKNHGPGHRHRDHVGQKDGT